MIIATDDPATAVQIHLRLGSEVVVDVSIEDIAGYHFGRDSWIVAPDDLRGWIGLALYSRGAVWAEAHGGGMQEVISQARSKELTAEKIQEKTPTYIGHLHPDVIFVGERPNPGTKFPRMTFQPGEVGCGNYLMRALEPVLSAGLRIGFMNAYYQGQSQRPPLVTPRYVALGQVASDLLSESMVTHARVDHPQYVRRFHHEAITRYSGFLLAAATTTDDYTALIRR